MYVRTLHIALREGLPQLTVPLPSRNEPCVFTLKPVTHTVGDLLVSIYTATFMCFPQKDAEEKKFFTFPSIFFLAF